MATDITSVKVAYADFPPFVHVRDVDGKEIIDGFMPEIVRSLAQWMGLKLQWIREPEDRYGTLENGTWNGMCGMLYREEVDLIVNPLLPDHVYAKIAHYTNPVIYEAFSILSGKQKMDGGIFLYFSVLQPMVWASIGISLVAIMLISSVMFLRITYRSKRWITTLAEYFWVYSAYMVGQSPNEKWIFLSSKRHIILLPMLPFLTTLWAVGVGLLIMSVFQSLLVSKLTIVRSKPTVNSMPEFLSKKDVIGITPIQIELQEVLKDSQIQVYEDTWKKLEPELVDIEEVFEKKNFKALDDGKICIFHGLLILRSVLSEYFQENGKCNYHISENIFFPFPLLMALRRSLPDEFLRKFNYGLTRLVDADLSGKWFKPITKTSHQCTSYSEKTLKPLSLKNIYGVLLIWTVGITTSVIVFIMEKMFYVEKRQSKPPRSGIFKQTSVDKRNEYQKIRNRKKDQEESTL